MSGASARHMMPAEAAIGVLDSLQRGGVDACVGGGWAVDALVREQTRDHADLDLWVDTAELDALITAMSGRDVDRLLPH